MHHPLTIEDVPLYNSSLAIMKFWSFLLRHNWRRYLSLIPYIMITITQFLDLYFSSEPAVAVIRNGYIAVLFFNTTLRAVVVCLNRTGYEEFLDKVRLLYIDLMSSKEKLYVEMLHETVKAANLITKVNLVMGASSVLGFLIYPIFATTKVLPFGIYVPSVDKYSSPFYQIFFVVQIIMAPIGCCMFVPFVNLVLALILFAILMCKVLQHKLRNLQGLTSEKAHKVIVWCIRYQLEVIKYVNTLNDLTTYTYLIEFLSFGAMLCAMLFCLISVETVGQMILICVYILMIFAQSTVLYYFANELYFESLGVAEAAYESDWFDFNVETQKSMKLLILRAQKPCAVLVGSIYPMNLELLQKLLNATYTYFTILKNVYG